MAFRLPGIPGVALAEGVEQIAFHPVEKHGVRLITDHGAAHIVGRAGKSGESIAEIHDHRFAAIMNIPHPRISKALAPRVATARTVETAPIVLGFLNLLEGG